MKLGNAILRRLALRPGRTVVVDDQRAWPAWQLWWTACHVASAIERSTTADRVGIMVPTSGLFPAATLGAWMAGRTCVPLNYLFTPQDMEHVCRDASIDCCVTIDPMLQFTKGLPTGVRALRMEDLPVRSVPRPRCCIPSRSDRLALLLYTSGTSGRPKGVMLTEDNLWANVRQVRDWAHFCSRDVVLGVLPQFHSFGFTVLTMMPLAVGARAIYTARFMPKKIVDLASRHRPTALVAIPSMYNALRSVKDAPKDAFSSLRFAVSGGEPLPQSVSDGFHEAFGVRIAEGYGLTETSPVVSWCLPHEYRWKSVGRPLHGVQFLIADANGQPVPQGHDGEVRIKGPNVMKGYFNLPTETAAAFDADGWFRTGDQGRLDADGHLSITGRIKEMLIIAGENVFPREIEEVLNHEPSIKESAVIGMSDGSRGEVPLAFVELHEGATFDEHAVRAWCRERLPGYKVPREFRVLAAMPRNPTGKVMRRALSASTPGINASL